MADTQSRPRTWFVTFQGKAGYHHLDQPDTKYVAEGKWSMQVTSLSTPSYDKVLELKEAGIKNTIKKNDDGYSLVVSRPCRKTIKGEIRYFEPPAIEDKDGLPLPRTTKIGHGSDITVTAEVYYTRPSGTGNFAANLRLASIRIDNLVPYSREDYDPMQNRAAKAQDATPPQTW